MNKGYGFAFIVTHIDIEDEISEIQLLKNFTFRRAKQNEIDIIKKRVIESLPPHFKKRKLPYEHIVTEEIYENRTSYHLDKIEKEKWKYWVIAFEGFGDELVNLKKALALLKTDLEIGFTINWFSLAEDENLASTYSPIPLHVVELISGPSFDTTNAIILKSKDVAKVNDLYDLITSCDNNYDFIEHALSNYMHLRMMPKTSEILVVGYFSIIEALTTHPPRLTETLDSISHQLKNKIVLIQKKFENEINYHNKFGEIELRKLWSKLYAYRSAIAHGSKVDFQKGTFSILKNSENVSWYLKTVVKELIIYSCKEPEFISDLKKC